MHSVYRQKREYAEELFGRSVPYIRECLKYPFESIGDFGCGFGLQVAEFARAGKEAHGYDLGFTDEALRESVAGEYHLWSGGWAAFDHMHDAGFSHHSLEHARDPIGWLNEWGMKIRPGGLMFVVVPAYSEYLSAGHIAMGWDSAKLAYAMALAGFDCSRGRFEQEGYTVFGVAERPAAFTLADNSQEGWGGVESRMPIELTLTSTIKPPPNIKGDGHDAIAGP